MPAAEDEAPPASSAAITDQAPPTPSPMKIFSLAAAEWPLLAFGFGLKLLGELGGLAIPFVMIQAWNAVVENYGPDGDKQLARDAVASASIFAISLHAVGGLLGFVSGSTIGLAGERVVTRLRVRLYDHMLSQEMGWFDGQKSGDLVSRLGSDTLLVQQATTQTIQEATLAAINFVTSITAMFLVSVELTAIVFGSLLAFVLFIAAPATVKISSLTRRHQDALAKAANVSTETLGSMRTVRAFSAEVMEQLRYANFIGDVSTCLPKRGPTTYYLGVVKAVLGSGLGASGFAIIFGAVQVSLWLGLNLVTYGKLTVGDLTAFQSYQFNIVFSTARLTGALMQLAQAMGGAARIFQLLERKSAMPLSGGKAPEESMRGEVGFLGVSFAYPTRSDITVLSNFSLTVAADSTAALVGTSGCGKSTCLALLLRFYDARSGAVTIDGIDVTSFDSTMLRTRMAYVQQEPVLFGLTIQENIEYSMTARKASEGATESDSQKTNPLDASEQTRTREKEEALARVKAACAKANAHDFIEKFDDGYDTLVGERGVRLSGGQKQRIAIARALLAEPRVLLLDEATSALDSESERLVKDAIDRASSGRTVIIVAHRLSTVQDADQIAVVQAGSVVDAGKHAALLERCKVYQTLVKRQMGATANAQAPSPTGNRWFVANNNLVEEVEC